MNSFIVTVSIITGMNLWFVPQISEHCPHDTPILLDFVLILFICPGMESILIFNDGIHHEWITSMDDMININGVLNGITILLSVSKILKLNFFLYIIYELNLISKFVYSYLQNHWLPIILIVILVIFISLFVYRIGIEIADIIKIINDGKIVHMVSMMWFSFIDLFNILFFVIITTIIDIMIIIIIINILSFNLFIFIIEVDSLNLNEYIKFLFIINKILIIFEF